MPTSNFLEQIQRSGLSHATNRFPGSCYKRWKIIPRWSVGLHGSRSA